MKLMVAALAAATTTTVAAQAAEPAAGGQLSGDDCILVRDIRDHAVVDQNTMLIDVWRKGTYKVTTAQACFRSATSSDPIAFTTMGREKICKAQHLGLHARSGWCGAQSIVRLSPAEVAALPKGLKP